MHNYCLLGEITDKGFTATTWQNLNNPVQSAGLNRNKIRNPERVQHQNFKTFQGFVLLFCLSTGYTGGYSHSSPTGFNK
jgi:hypothetical protein